MVRPTVRLNAEMLSDSAIYRRTALGQRKLASAEGQASTPALRILGSASGYSNLRQLVDLASGDTSDFGRTIQRLLFEGLIERVDDGNHDLNSNTL